MSLVVSIKQSLSLLHTYLNNNPGFIVSDTIASKLVKLREKNVIKRTFKGYMVDILKLAKVTAKYIGISYSNAGPCSNRSIAWVEEEVIKNVSIVVFWSFTFSDDIINCVVDTDNFIVPIIISPSKTIEELFERQRKVLSSLANKTLHDLRILLLFPIILPLPTIVKTNAKSKKDFFKEYKESINRIKDILQELGNRFLNTNEYKFLAEYKRLILAKSLTPFAFLHDLLDDYGIVSMREKKAWKKPSKWFEEVIKLLLIDTFVRNSFSGNVVEYLVKKYKTGGPNQEDIAIPIRKGGAADIYIIDTKLWKEDVCKTLTSGRECLSKYGHYVHSTTKSTKLKKLEELVKREVKSINCYYLLFIQRKTPSKACLAELTKLNIRGYCGTIKVYSLEQFASAIIKRAF